MQFYGCGWADTDDADSARGGQEETQQLQHQDLYFLQELMRGGSLHQLVLKAMASPVGAELGSVGMA